jgi:hypothetical protein
MGRISNSALTGRDKLEYVTSEMPAPVQKTSVAPTADEKNKEVTRFKAF